MLGRAIEFAVEAHKGQVDKAGKPYILHPLRVMLSGKTEEEMICGVLHDVIEDTPVSIDMLRKEGFSENVLRALDCVSRREGENYGEFITRTFDSELAMKVKRNDLHDNMNRDRIVTFTEADERRWEKYEKALRRINERLGDCEPNDIG